MYVDSALQVSTAQALSASGASEDYVDQGAARNLGDGEPMAMVVHVDVAATTNDNDETYEFGFQSDSDSGFGTVVTHVSRVISRTLLTAGTKHVVPIPPNVSIGRYYRAYYTLGGSTPAITVTTDIKPMSMIQKDAVYADNVTIS